MAQIEDSNPELHWLDEDAEDESYENLDANRPNRRGRLPLHSLCATAWYDLQDGRHSGLEYLADYFIGKTKDIDAADASGVRPLHLAYMMSEWMVKRLLTAGADPMSVTSEGLTSLHLAARAREANIVGLLIDELDKVPGRLQQSLDAPDQTGRSPLFTRAAPAALSLFNYFSTPARMLISLIRTASRFSMPVLSISRSRHYGKSL